MRKITFPFKFKKEFAKQVKKGRCRFVDWEKTSNHIYLSNKLETKHDIVNDIALTQILKSLQTCYLVFYVKSINFVYIKNVTQKKIWKSIMFIFEIWNISQNINKNKVLRIFFNCFWGSLKRMWVHILNSLNNFKELKNPSQY